MLANKGRKNILDTSALIALLRREPGYQMVANVIADSAISSVNLSEFVTLLVRSRVTESDIHEITNNLLPEVIPFCERMSLQAGKLTNITQPYGLSLGDRACLATGHYHQAIVYTADRIWADLPLSGVEIKLIR